MSMPTESTALLGNTPIHLADRIQPLPPVYPLNIQALPGQDPSAIAIAPSASHVFPTAAAKAAFDLIVLLQSFAIEKAKLSERINRDVWDTWSKEIDVSSFLHKLERITLDLWSEFLRDYRSTQEIEELLWLEFPVENGSLKRLRGTLAPKSQKLSGFERSFSC